jgi:HSP20 family protein
VARAEVPGSTEKGLNIVAEPWRLVITGKREWERRGQRRGEKGASTPHGEDARIYRTVKFPLEIKPEGVKAILKNGLLEITLPKAEFVKRVKIEVKLLWPSHINNQTETAICFVPEARRAEAGSLSLG